MIRMEVVDVQAILASSFTTVSHNIVTVETPFAQRRDIINQFQTNQLEVLVSTPGIVGRGIELRCANSVGVIIGFDIRSYCGPLLRLFLSSYIMLAELGETVAMDLFVCSVMPTIRRYFKDSSNWLKRITSRFHLVHLILSFYV